MPIQTAAESEYFWIVLPKKDHLYCIGTKFLSGSIKNESETDFDTNLILKNPSESCLNHLISI